jgi:cell wall-associated NlpC family hydrolase
MRRALSITLASIVLAVTAIVAAPTTASAWTTHRTYTTTSTNRAQFNDPKDYPAYFSIKVKGHVKSGKGVRGKATLFINGSKQRTRNLKYGNILFRVDRSALRDNRDTTIAVRIRPSSKYQRDTVVRRVVRDVPRGEYVLRKALAQRGDPYARGGTGPSRFDCSGLTSYAYRAIGKSIPRTSSAQRDAGSRVSSPRRGDIVWTPGHVSIYAGNGKVVEAARPGTRVRYIDMWQRSPKYYRF